MTHCYHEFYNLSIKDGHKNVIPHFHSFPLAAQKCLMGSSCACTLLTGLLTGGFLVGLLLQISKFSIFLADCLFVLAGSGIMSRLPTSKTNR